MFLHESSYFFLETADPSREGVVISNIKGRIRIETWKV
jgi:hypothetical protein